MSLGEHVATQSAIAISTADNSDDPTVAPSDAMQRARSGGGARRDSRLRDRAAIVAWTGCVATFNLIWYGIYLSFPLVGEDGAANYSTQVEAVQHSDWLSLSFPIKWLEGLGQPNAFTPLTFDPFSWLLLLDVDPGDALRVSYALRATVCWLGAYVLARALFRKS